MDAIGHFGTAFMSLYSVIALKMHRLRLAHLCRCIIVVDCIVAIEGFNKQ